VTRTRLVLADDNSAVLSAVAAELAEEFEIVTTVHNGQDAINAAARIGPDVLVLDIDMPVLNGLEVASRLRNASPCPKILFLTIHEQPEYISAAFSAGASAYVTKRCLLVDLGLAIREVAKGNTFLSPSLRR
jgi:DNA-binding NarL/FixJ family response regulator